MKGSAERSGRVGGLAQPASGPRRSPVATVTAVALLALVTVIVGLALCGKISLLPESPPGAGTVFYVVPYHYGFAFYDSRFAERQTMEVKAGEVVTLSIVPSQVLGKETFFEYAERTVVRSIGGLAAGDPQIRRKILEDLELGNVEHIVGIASHPVYVTTDVATALRGALFRTEGSRALSEAVHQKDPAIKSVTFTAKRVGAFDVICVDSGMDGSGTCGWGHKWMVGKGAFVVRP